MISLNCPTCKGVLKYPPHIGDFCCPACGHSYRNRDGVIDFIPKNNFYWGELDQDLMRQVNDQALTKGWFRSLLDNIPQELNLLNYLLDPVRVAGIYHCYDPSMNEICLDLGSGWGPISTGLARFYKFVYSVDGVYERLRFQAIRAFQDGLNNIAILRSEMLGLPIPDRSVDLVVINGLLEWIGMSRQNVNPKYLQEKFLKEVYRVLKDGGKVLIGIENRFGAQYFAGGKDHSGLRFTSIMPRWMSNYAMARSQNIKRQFTISESETSYRTLTYSYWGYKQLLKSVGFILPELFWVWPGYNYPRASGKLDGRSVKYYLAMVSEFENRHLYRAIFRFLHKLPNQILEALIKYFSPHFLIVASKTKNNPSIQERILRNSNNDSSFLRLTWGTRIDLKTTFIILDNHGATEIIRASESSQGGHYSSFSVNKMNLVKGVHISPHNPRHIGMLANWLARFQESTAQGYWDITQLENEIIRLCDQASLFITDYQLAKSLETYAERYRSFIRYNDIPVVKEHGDFTPTNILIADNNIEPIDWEHQSEYGNPLMDPGGFIFSQLIKVNKFGVAGEKYPFGKPVKEFTNSYNPRFYLPINFAPTYYLLRIICRCAINPLAPSQYLCLQKWIKHLPKCVKYSFELEQNKMGG